jgi:hypothetical protein
MPMVSCAQNSGSWSVFQVFNALHECDTLLSARVLSERAHQHVEEQENILEMVQCSPTTSTGRLSTCLGVSRKCAWRTLHDDSLYPFHLVCVQNLQPGNSAMHVEFCHWLHTNCQLLSLILFTDEAFTRNGINNTCNLHRWSHNNSHSTVQTNFQCCFSINVWCGMIDAMLINPIILDNCMTGYNYLDFLLNGLPELEDVPSATWIAMYFQCFGAPSHYTQLVMQHLDATFHNRWVVHNSTINWPERSPDLTLLDFCLCGCMKSKIYRRKVTIRDELPDHISCTQTNMPCPHMSCRVHWCWWNFQKCILGKL